MLHLEKREIKFQNESTEVFNPNAGDISYFSSTPTDGKEFLPEYQHEKLKTKVEKILRQSVGENGKRQLTSKAIREIRLYFFKFFVSLFYKYRKAIKLEKDQKINIDSPGDHFNREKFLSECCRDETRPFLSEFIDTNLFRQFIAKKINPKSEDDYYTTLYFDQHADLKAFAAKGGKIEDFNETIPFLSDKSQRSKEKFTVPDREDIKEKLAHLIEEYVKAGENKETVLLPLDLKLSRDNSYKYILFPRFVKALLPPEREYDISRLP